jgi:hypothetical protein
MVTKEIDDRRDINPRRMNDTSRDITWNDDILLSNAMGTSTGEGGECVSLTTPFREGGLQHKVQEPKKLDILKLSCMIAEKGENDNHPLNCHRACGYTQYPTCHGSSQRIRKARRFGRTRSGIRG